MAGAPEGNTNAKRGMECRQALKRALSRKSENTYREGLDMVMDEYVAAACNGESWAIRDMIDRLDGKPAQSHEITVPDGIAMAWTVEVVEPDHADDPSSE